MAAFREEAARGGVCVAREEALRAAPGAAAVAAALRRLQRGPRVAVCWCEGRTARALLEGMARSAAEGILIHTSALSSTHSISIVMTIHKILPK